MFDADFYQLIESMMAKSIKRRVRRAVKAAKCIRDGCDRPAEPGCRDACKQHYNQFDYGRRIAKKQGAAALKRFEKTEVAEGRIGPSHRGSNEKNDYKLRVVKESA